MLSPPVDWKGLNNFQSMPTLPGNSAPLAIAAESKKRKAGQGKAKAKSRPGKDKDEPPQDMARSVSKKDQELHQIDLMRKQLLLGQSTDAWPHHEMSFADVDALLITATTLA